MVDKRYKRCSWCGHDPDYIDYHDNEWAVPLHDDRRLFEMLVLEGAQAGLSWITILKKRPAYRRAFHDFDMEKIARYNTASVRRLMVDKGIVRNRLKIESTIANARATLKVIENYSSLDHYFWQFVDGKPIQNHYRHMSEVPVKTDLSDRMSRDLKHHGFRFVGSTICYAYMQAIGMVNDHLVSCYRYKEVKNG